MAGRKAVSTGSNPRRSSRSAARSAHVAEQQGPEMSPLKSETAPPTKHPSRNAAARGRWGEEQLLTSEKSQLITVDLVKLLSKPEAWNFLDEDEKREILALLPGDAHPDLDSSPDNADAKIPPLPQSFLRYSNHWRDGIRQFQTDLQNGRYNPKWLRQAQEARQQRAKGDFDSFKDREYEQFWGQKQKIDMRELAGDSAKVKLTSLVTAGLVHTGDVWRFTRVFLNDGEKIPVDKEARVLEINGAKLKFAIPGGQRIFISSIQRESQTYAVSDEGKETGGGVDVNAEAATSTSSEKKDECKAPQVVIINKKVDNTKPTVGEGLKRTAPEPEPQLPVKRKRGRPRKNPAPTQAISNDEGGCEISPAQKQESYVPAGLDISGDSKPSSLETPESSTPHDDTKSCGMPSNMGQKASEISSTLRQSQNGFDLSIPPPPANEPGEIMILHDISTPGMLATKIIQADGRVGNYHHANPWKEIRCYRNNQDMGSLWDIRQAWFLKQN